MNTIQIVNAPPQVAKYAGLSISFVRSMCADGTRKEVKLSGGPKSDSDSCSPPKPKAKAPAPAQKKEKKEEVNRGEKQNLPTESV